MQLKGKLEFISLLLPIKLFVGDNVLDLQDNLSALFKNLNGKPSVLDYGMNKIEIKYQTGSEYHMKYERDDDSLLIILKKTEGFGFSNVDYYLSDMLQRLNGAEIIVDIEEESVAICLDPEFKHHELNFTRNNVCSVTDEDAKTICKVGSDNTCIFCALSGGGFECLKFDSPSARSLLHRFSEKSMNANRIGDCIIIGRKES